MTVTTAIEVVIAHKVVAHADHVRLVALARPLSPDGMLYADDDIRMERLTNDGAEVYTANFGNIIDAMARFNLES